MEVNNERNLVEFYIANDKIKLISNMVPLNRVAQLYQFYCYDLTKKVEDCGFAEMDDERNWGIFCFDCIHEESEYIHERLRNGATIGDLL